MKIFLSHCSRDKPTVREFRECLPSCLTNWLDEDSLRWGDLLPSTIEKAIRSDVDFLVVFIAEDTLNSQWVQRELGWAFEREKELNRTFVLPILMQRAQGALPESLRDRLYLELPSTGQSDIKQVAHKASEQLFRLVIELMEQWAPRAPHAHDDVVDLSTISRKFDDALQKFSEDRRQHSFIREHIRALRESLFIESGRLRDGEVTTDYDDVSLLTTFLNDLNKGEALLGLTDWDTDQRWWESEDANRFLQANKHAINKGADISRIFVFGSSGDKSPERRAAMRKHMREHIRIGVHVCEVDVSALPAGCHELRSQCVLFSPPAGAGAGWLTYKVQRDARGVPLRNVFSVRESDISDNVKMLKTILKEQGNRRMWSTEECGHTCYTDDPVEPYQDVLAEGRRLYIHKTSFDLLAKRGRDAAEMVYSALVAVPAVKLAFHDLGQEAVVKQELSRAVADGLERAISKRWYAAATDALRRIGYCPDDRKRRGAFLPLLTSDESILATCFDSDYYTFATSERAARRMYSDVLKMSEVRRLHNENNPAFRDLVLIKGDSLALIDPTVPMDGDQAQPEFAQPDNADTFCASEFAALKAEIAKSFESELEEIISELGCEASPSERIVWRRFVSKCADSVRRIVLSLPTAAS